MGAFRLLGLPGGVTDSVVHFRANHRQLMYNVLVGEAGGLFLVTHGEQ